MNLVGPPPVYVSCKGRARWASSIIIVGIVLSSLSLVSSEMQAQLLGRAAHGVLPTDSEAGLNDLREAVIGILDAAAIIAGLVLFLVWIHRAHKNLPALGAKGLAYSPGWTVGYFFIPILCFFRPYQAATEIWKASDPLTVGLQPSRWQAASGSAMLGFWWVMWLIDCIVGRVVFHTAFRAHPTVHDLIAQTRLAQVSTVTSVLSAALTLALIRALTGRQERKHAALGAMGAPAPTI